MILYQLTTDFMTVKKTFTKAAFSVSVNLMEDFQSVMLVLGLGLRGLVLAKNSRPKSRQTTKSPLTSIL